MESTEPIEADRLRVIERCLSDGACQVDGAANFAMSADQRAITIAGTYISAATAITAGLVAWSAITTPVLVAGTLSAILFYFGALICIWVAFPQISYTAGNPPDFWEYHLKHATAYEDSLFSQIEEYTRKIAAHKVMLKRNAVRYKVGALIGAAAPVVGVVAYFILTCALAKA